MPSPLQFFCSVLRARMGVPNRHGARAETTDAALRIERSQNALHVQCMGALLQSVTNAVIITDATGRITQFNPVAQRLTGWHHNDAVGRPISDVFRVINEITREPAPDPLTIVHQHGRAVGLSLRSLLLSRADQEYAIEDSVAPLFDDSGALQGVVIVFRDVTEEQTLQQRLLHQATHDALTGLPNRTLLVQQLAQSLALASRKQWRVALLAVDLDHFKVVNDSLGHAVGDRLLREVAARIAASVRESDMVSRQGGDEFLIMLPDASNDDVIIGVAKRIVEALAQPFAIEGHDLQVTSSIGISVYPRDGDDSETLIKCADAAMYASKESGRNNYRFFSREMQQRAMERLSLEAAMRQGLAREEFVLYYQPKVEVTNQRIVGAEALVRWRHPDDQLISPTRFIPIAEETGLILPLGRWVLERAAQAAAAWQREGFADVTVAVNVSALQFRQADFVATVASVVRDTGLSPERLELELTESLVMADVEDTIRRLCALKDMGIRLSLDDFGTGYSSLAYLKRFPLDSLKIDRGFIRDVHRSGNESAIASAIVSLGRSLGLNVIAEGVETEAHLEFLRLQQCPHMQGYLFSPPVALEVFRKLLAKHRQSGQALSPAHNRRLAHP